MAPDPRRWRRITPATAATLLLIGLGAAAPVTAHAAQPFRLAAAPSAPSPTPTTEKGLRKSLDALNEEAEILTEKYNKTRVDFGKARKAEQAAAQEARRLRALAEPARQQLGRLAAANYMAGGPDVIFGAGRLRGRPLRPRLPRAEPGHRRPRAEEADRPGRRRPAHRRGQDRAGQEGLGGRQEGPRGGQDQGRRGDEAPRQADHHARPRPPQRPHRHREGLRAPREDGPQGPHQARQPLRVGRRRPNSFDCSGLVVWAYAQVGKSGLPHYTGDLFGLGTKVSRGALRSGDLVYFGSNLHHMGIYLGGGKYLHAPQTGDVVKISNMSDRSDYAGANRIS
ncbi:NlpC/P60 family protein [Actinomadura madurae]|uniref:NlpC/P60 family protein n=1 Tax=Actinomadura madurae TaxID=1993 RepID=UPI0020D1F838|nr:NlpC/P60 family protein [Actinomadura madurae]MCP9966984.1 NlpC/P60 family protein [Actinomadura madurae]